MDTMFLGLQAVLGIAFMTLMVGLILIPNLMLEEKQSHTIDTLLVSPASVWHIAIAKTLTRRCTSGASSSELIICYNSLSFRIHSNGPSNPSKRYQEDGLFFFLSPLSSWSIYWW
jgi:hypothetical protein